MSNSNTDKIKDLAQEIYDLMKAQGLVIDEALDVTNEIRLLVYKAGDRARSAATL